MPNSKNITRKCPVCDSKKYSVIKEFSYALFDDLDISGKKTLVYCKLCGMLYDQVGFTEKQLLDYYCKNEHYVHSKIGGNGNIAPSNIERYEEILSILKPNKNKIILDFGCGQGGFLDFCASKGFEAIGIEPSKTNRCIINSRGRKVFDSLISFLRNSSEAKRVNYIVMSHVLEHIFYPKKILSLIASNMPHAKIYIEVPDAKDYLGHSVQWHEMFFEHISHFTKKNLCDLASLYNIKISHIDKKPFSRIQNDVQCVWFVGKISGVQNSNFNVFCEKAPCIMLPDPPQADLDNFLEVSIWGISSFAMLLIGTYYKNRIKRLFDSSPAKIGRKINGIVIEHPDNIASLTQNSLLLLPFSPYLQEMKNFLNKIKFKGKIITVGS